MPELLHHTSAGPLSSFVLDEDEDAPPVSQQLASALKKSAGRVMDLLRAWDEDGNGVIDRDEFTHALRYMGLQVSDEIISSLFDEWDTDGDGMLDEKELSRVMRNARAANKKMKKKKVEEPPVPVVNVSELWVNVKEMLQDHRFRIESPTKPKPTAEELVKLAVDACAKAAEEAKANEPAAAEVEDATAVAEAEAEPMPDPLSPTSEVRKLKARDRRRLHLKLRLKGTDLDVSEEAASDHDAMVGMMEAHTKRMTGSLKLIKPAKKDETTELGVPNPGEPVRSTVTRHGRLPAIKEQPGKEPKLLDVLSAHRRRSHVPARHLCTIVKAPQWPPKKTTMRESQSMREMQLAATLHEIAEGEARVAKLREELYPSRTHGARYMPRGPSQSKAELMPLTEALPAIGRKGRLMASRETHRPWPREGPFVTPSVWGPMKYSTSLPGL